MLQKEVFYLIMTAFGLVGLIAILAFGYSLFADLRKRTIQLEKRNGHEQHQIDQLKKDLAEQKEINLKLISKVQQLEQKLQEYEK
ncbi:MAG: Cell division coordinator CpoB [Mycoplasmataceae bacterium]|nr:MAG: Cell division coordinator CpoB [Mycoplasmataceae bacterium]